MPDRSSFVSPLEPDPMVLDAADRRILRALQAQGRLSNNDLAARVGLSTSPCWRRTRRLEEAGAIASYSANLDRRRLGLGVLVFVSVQLDTHSESDVMAFERAVLELEQIVACYSVGGGVDFLLQVVCPTLDAYAEFAMTVLRRLPGIKAMTSNFALKEIKPFKGFPVHD